MSTEITAPRVKRVKDGLEQKEDHFKSLLNGNQKQAKKLISSVTEIVSQSSVLLNCSLESIFFSVAAAAKLGLEINNDVLGQGYLVPYKGKCTFIPGYKGYMVLADNNGYQVRAEVVREGDEFRIGLGTNPYLVHNPTIDPNKKKAEIKICYAIADRKDQRNSTTPPIFTFLTAYEINEKRDNSENYKAYLQKRIKSTAWVTHYEAMALKSAIITLVKKLPLKTFNNILEIDLDNDDKPSASIIEHDEHDTGFKNVKGNIQPDVISRLNFQDNKECWFCKDKGVITNDEGKEIKCSNCQQ